MYSIVLAMDMHGLIGKENDLPWHYPEDLKYFKDLTSNKKVLMGRLTFDSIFNRLGKPLPNRINIVASRKGMNQKDVEVVNNLEAFLKIPREEEIFIIGGKQIFDMALPYVDCMYITYIKGLFDGDTFMLINYSGFKMEIIKETEDLLFSKYVRIDK